MNKNQTTFAKALKTGAILVLVLVIALVGKNLLSTNSASAYSKTASVKNPENVAVLNGDVQEVTIQLATNAYAPIVVQKGVPVRFHIQAEQKNITGCNGTVIIPAYHVQVALKAGDNVLEFTPKETGTLPYSCWMGMVTSSIQVVDDIANVDSSTAVAPGANSGSRMSCCQRKPQ